MFFSSNLPSYITPKKKRPLQADKPDFDRILRSGESEENFTRFLTLLSYELESFKFLPLFESLSYTAGKGLEAALSEFGDGAKNPFAVTNTDLVLTDKNGNNNVNWDPAGMGANIESFGGHHIEAWTDDESGGSFYWGTNDLLTAQKNTPGNFTVDDLFNLNKIAGSGKAETECKKPVGLDKAYYSETPVSYENLWSSNGDVKIKVKEGKKTKEKVVLGGGGVTQLVDQYFGNKSYYEIVMSGSKNNSKFEAGTKQVDGVWSDVVSWKGEDPVYSTDLSAADYPYWGSFAYDLGGQQGMFARVALFIAMRESLRRVEAASTEIFGNATNMSNGLEGSLANIETLDAAMEGLSVKNQAALLFFLEIQHSLRNQVHGICSSPIDKPSMVVSTENKSRIYSAKDGLCMDRFRWLMYKTVTVDYPAYLNTLGESDEINNYKTMWNNLVTEAYDSTQPYIGSPYKSNYYSGWDLAVAPGTEIGDVYQMLPTTVWKYNADGDVVNAEEQGHWSYSFAQVKKLSDLEKRGQGGTGNASLYNTNWVIHAYGRYLKAIDATINYNVSITAFNRRSVLKTKKENEKREEDIETQRQEELETKKAEAKAIAKKKAQAKNEADKTLKKAIAEAKKEQKIALERSQQQRKTQAAAGKKKAKTA